MSRAGVTEQGSRGPGRGATTRGALLEAARRNFVESGFAETTVTDVVARAGTSIGGLYHHFSGKADLYVALFEEFQDRQLRRTRRAVNKAQASTPMAALIAGARAYLDGCIMERDLASLFLRGDGPPGFEVLMRERMRQWARRSTALLDDGDDALTVVIAGAMAGAMAEVTLALDETTSRRLAEDVLAVLARLGA